MLKYGNQPNDTLFAHSINYITISKSCQYTHPNSHHHLPHLNSWESHAFGMDLSIKSVAIIALLPGVILGLFEEGCRALANATLMLSGDKHDSHANWL